MLGSRDKKRADRIFETAKCFAIASYQGTSQRYSLLRQVDPAAWDRIVLVASIWSLDFGASLPAASQGIGLAARKQFLSRLSQSQVPDPPRWFDDLSKFVVARSDLFAQWISNGKPVGGLSTPQFRTELTVCVGYWIFWNLLDREPEEAETEVVAALGTLFCGQWLSAWYSLPD